MSEMESRRDERISMEHHYGDASFGVKGRFNVYNYSEDGRNIEDEAVESFDLAEPSGVIVDVGCSDGGTLRKMRSRFPEAHLVGIDIVESRLGHTASGPTNLDDLNIAFVAGSVSDLPLKPESVDAMTALFVLYHAHDPAHALRECYEALKPGGTFIVATSGERNKERHREFERYIARITGALPPPIFSEPFNSHVAMQELPKLFIVDEHIEQLTRMRIDTEEGMDDYLLSLLTMKDDFSPIPHTRIWRPTLEVTIRDTIEAEIKNNGYFWDTIDRHLFVCRKPDVDEV